MKGDRAPFDEEGEVRFAEKLEMDVEQRRRALSGVYGRGSCGRCRLRSGGHGGEREVRREERRKGAEVCGRIWR